MIQNLEGFIIENPYSKTVEDEELIRQASPDNFSSKDWEKSCLDGFKARVRDYYFKIQNRRCAYCRTIVKTSQASAEIDHIVPKSSKPKWMYEPFNLCISCKSCNTKKSRKKVLKGSNIQVLPHNSNDYFIIHPHLDDYFENIRIIEGIFYEGISDKGKWTIEKCCLDRNELALDRAEEIIRQEGDIYMRILLALLEERERPLVNIRDSFLDRIKDIIREYKRNLHN